MGQCALRLDSLGRGLIQDLPLDAIDWIPTGNDASVIGGETTK